MESIGFKEEYQGIFLVHLKNFLNPRLWVTVSSIPFPQLQQGREMAIRGLCTGAAVFHFDNRLIPN